MTTESVAAPRVEIAPAVVLIGDLLIKGLEWTEHLDFLLSVRDEKLATILEIYRDFGWWIVAIAAFGWFLYEYKRHEKDQTVRGSIGSLVASVAFVAFLLGSIVTVRATGSVPNIILNYGGTFDPSRQVATCTADVDVSRLSGFADDYRLILICGMLDSSTDALDDTRVAVSSPFHISVASSGMGMMGMVAPFGKLADILKTVTPPTVPPPLGQSAAVSFQMWHAVAIIPKDVQADSIKKASDVKQVGGRILTEPIPSFGSPMQIPMPTPPPQPVAKGAKT